MSGRQFGHRFQKSLFEAVSFGKMAQDHRKLLGDHNKTRLFKSKRLRDFIYKCNRVTLDWLCDFCRIDLLAGDSDQVRWRQKWWPQLVLVTLIANIWLLVDILRRQYSSDFQLFSYRQLETKLNETDHFHGSREALEERLREAGRKLGVANATAHSSMPFVGQYTILYYLSQALIAHILIPVKFYRSKWILLAIRAILNEPEEAATWTRLVVEELEHLTRDNLASMASKQDQIGEILANSDRRIRPQSGHVGPLLGSADSRLLMQSNWRLATGHEQLKVRLRRIALGGRLNRIQRSPRCRDYLALAFFVALWSLLFNFALGFLICNKYLKSIFKMGGASWDLHLFNSTADLLSVSYLVITTIIATAFSCALLIAAVLDQMLYVHRMKLMMRHLIEVNTRRVLEMVAIAKRLDDNYALELRLKFLNEALEADLLVIILQWRLATRCFELLRRPITLMVVFAAYIAVWMPILFRLHSPYLPDEIKQIQPALSLFATGVTIACLLPLAALHRLWLEVFGTLWSLVALLGRLESAPAIRECLMTGGSSMVTLTLRREVSDPIRVESRFACRILSVPITYANLIRTCAWLVLLLSSLYDSQHNLFGSWLGNYMDDPFGLFHDNVDDNQ